MRNERGTDRLKRMASVNPSFCHLLSISLCVLGSLLIAAPLFAQQTNVNSPFNRTSQGFSEYIGVQWGVTLPGGAFFRFGGPPPANAPQGGARFGTGFNSGGVSGYFNLFAGQSSHAGLSSGSSNLTLSNGQPGGLFVGRQVPFVMGVVPVVGDGGNGSMVPYAPRSVLQERLQRLRAEGVDLRDLGYDPPSTEGELGLRNEPAPVAPQPAVAPPVASVEAIAAQRAAADAAQEAKLAEEVAIYLAKAEEAISAGKDGVARIYLQMAQRRAPADQQAEISARLRSLSSR